MSVSERIEKLKKELQELEVLEKKKPQRLLKPNWDLVVSHVVKFVEKGPEKDDQHYLFEECIDAVYGPGIWEYLNKRDR